jgi:hypothetical protein
VSRAGFAVVEEGPAWAQRQDCDLRISSRLLIVGGGWCIIGSVAHSLRSALAGVGIDGAFSFRGDLHSPRPNSIRALLDACTSPRCGEWRAVNLSFAENTSYSEEGQGVTMGDGMWFIVSNANDDREGLYRLSSDWSSSLITRAPYDTSTHLGAPCATGGWVYVPTQHPDGVWKVSTDLTQSVVLKAEDSPDPDMFSWCSINPWSGLLYTSAFEHPDRLVAYDASAMSNGVLPRAEPDIPITHGFPATEKVQGAAFTRNFRILMLRDVPNSDGVQCHSTLTGVLQDRYPLDARIDETQVFSNPNELEGIFVQTLTTGGQVAHVHVLELDNDDVNADDIYVWHLAVPDPQRL